MPASKRTRTAEDRASRRAITGVLGLAGAAAMLGPRLARAETNGLAAAPPRGFVPLVAPGKVVRVTKGNCLQPNGLWPESDAAAQMLERAMVELTGKADLGAAFARFVHPDDKVAIKLNGIAGQNGATMATNKELVLPIVKGVIAAGVPAERIVLFEQYRSFLAGTRVVGADKQLAPEFPAGIVATVHENKDATMPEIRVAGIATRFVRPFTEATAVINVAMMKDHSITGYTGCLKNITHGALVNPHAFHEHHGSPQIALLYAQQVARSRVRLHIVDAFKVIYDGGPLDTKRQCRVPHEAVYASTDPVATDVVGLDVIERLRKEKRLPTLEAAGRSPTYIRVAGELGLGVFDPNRISLREIAL